jgi:hypothetical protein
MKSIIFCLGLLVAVSVQARGVIAQGKNESDMTISLTDAKCRELKDTKVAYLTYRDGSATFGCWAADESRVLILWDTGTVHSYSHTFFEQGKKP